MRDEAAEAAIEAAFACRRAIVTCVSARVVGVSGRRGRGFDLPAIAWRLFASCPPRPPAAATSAATVRWHDGTETPAVLKWSGQGAGALCRLTGFGRQFNLLNEPTVGSWLVLVPWSDTRFSAFVVETDDGIDEIRAWLGVELIDRVEVFPLRGSAPVGRRRESPTQSGPSPDHRPSSGSRP